MTVSINAADTTMARCAAFFKKLIITLSPR